MALQDLTPQLRTRLSRMERAVGWFVIFATALLLFGLGYYVYQRAMSKGWFKPKFKYQTWLNNAAGLKAGDKVLLMGFPAGEVTEIIPNAPDAFYGVTIYFTVIKPHYGYIWDDSKVKVASDFLGNRFLEITKGVTGLPTIDVGTNEVPRAMLKWQFAEKEREAVVKEIRDTHPDMEQTNLSKFNWFLTDKFKARAAADYKNYYTGLGQTYGLQPLESPALNDRLERLANQIETALPNILGLTNQLATVLSNSANLTSNLNFVATGARPAVSNLTILTAQLNQPGALGEWLLPTNVNQKLESVLGGADATLVTANTNIAILAQNLNRSLENISDITSNLNSQVQANTNMLTAISTAIVDADNLVQGLKRHWLLRSAFKGEKTNRPPVKPTPSPRQR
jgi:hypothetical protein